MRAADESRHAKGNAVAKTLNASSSLTNRYLRWFAWFTAAATLLLICSGGMVTSKNAGMAVPDWPTTFGYNMFFFPFSKWIGGIFFEHTHRLAASTVGFLTIILALGLAFSRLPRWLKSLGWISLGLVILQGVLGGLRVLLNTPEIGIFHACVAQGFFGLLVFIALALSPVWERVAQAAMTTAHSRSLARGAIVISVIIYFQLALGATMRHQHRDLSITDFPLAYGQIIPRTDPATIAKINQARDRIALSDVTAAQIWLQLVHRFCALLIGFSILAYWLFVRRNSLAPSALRKLSTLWLLLVVTQIALGGWVILSNKAADIATAHVAIGAITFVTGVALCALTLRIGKAPLPAPADLQLAEARLA